MNGQVIGKYWLFIFCTINATLMSAQSLTQTVKGRVVDAETGAAIMGATIQLLDPNLNSGTITDIEGFFVLEKIPVGRRSFLCKYLGFEDYYISEVLVGSAKEINLTIPLQEAVDKLDEVILTSPKDRIRPNNKMASVSARSFSVEETKRFPASISDPSRMALSFAGVTNSDDSSNEIIIRGNAPNQLLWRIEGIEVPQPNHFSAEGYNAGAVSILSTNMLGKSDFFTGAFPAEYGNALSGVFDINLRNGNRDKTEYAFQFGALGADIAAEGPLNKNHKGSYLVNYRYSTTKLLNNVVEVSENSVPTYQDISFKLNLPLGENTQFSVWGIGGISENNNDNEQQNNSALLETERFKSKTYLSGVNLKHFFKDRSSLQAIVSYSGNYSNDFNSYKEINTDIPDYSDRTTLKNNALRFSAHYTKKVNAKTTLKTGTIFSVLHYDVLEEFTENNRATSDIDKKGNGRLTQFFAQMKYRFNKNLWASFGVHNTYFSINKDYVFEPRASLQWKLAPKHTLSVGVGLHSRVLPLNQYFVQNTDAMGVVSLPNQNLKLTRALHYILGYDWRIIKNGHFKIEGYYQDLSNIGIQGNAMFTDAVVNGEPISDVLTDNGTGRNYGLELTLEKFFSDQYYFLFTSSLYDSKYRAADGNWYNSRYNYKYTFNAVVGKEFTVGRDGNNVFGINAKTLLNGGQRFTPFDIGASLNEETEVVVQSRRNTGRLKEYFRLDTSFYFRLNRANAAHVFSLDIQNLTNRKNVMGQSLNLNTGLIEVDNQLNLVPVINYRIEF
ncbi:TonB-dependent receptor [Flavobacteriaceae bacterium 3-367]